MNDRNPWLAVPLADYEGHMNSANVKQLDALSKLFGSALAFTNPTSVAILGIAGGNGLEHINSERTNRIVAIDVNATYLDAVRERYPSLHGLKLHRIDLSRQVLHLKPVQLVHAALVFEHAGVDRCLENALSLVAEGGALSVVLQLPSQTEAGVSPTEFPTIQNLKTHFSIIDPAWFQTTLESRHFELKSQIEHPLPVGKSLWTGIFFRH